MDLKNGLLDANLQANNRGGDFASGPLGFVERKSTLPYLR